MSIAGRVKWNALYELACFASCSLHYCLALICAALLQELLGGWQGKLGFKPLNRSQLGSRGELGIASP